MNIWPVILENLPWTNKFVRILPFYQSIWMNRFFTWKICDVDYLYIILLLRTFVSVER